MTLDWSSASRYFYRLQDVRTWESCFISKSEFCVSLKFPPNDFDVSTMQSFYTLANSRLSKMPQCLLPLTGKDFGEDWALQPNHFWPIRAAGAETRVGSKALYPGSAV